MFAVQKKYDENCTHRITVYNKLPTFEICIYYIGWITGMIYMLYSVYLASIGNQNRNELVVDGWPFVGLKKDVADFVLETAYNALGHILLYGTLHYIMAECVKRVSRKILPYYYVLFSLSIITYHSSYKTGIAIIVQALLSCIVAHFGDKFYIWSYGLIAIATVYFPQENLFNWCNLQHSQQPFILNLFMWNNLRYISFALYINKKKETNAITCVDFVNFLGYYFYFPTASHGPLLLYEDFQNVYKIQTEETFYTRSLKFIASIIKYTGYFYLTMLLLHFLHYGLLFHLQFIQASYSASHGFFWWAGFLFMLKHIILYGLATSAARAETIKTPNPPKCIARIGLYSVMWNSFDQSMYWFKKRYIFEAFVNTSKSKLKQTMGSLLCFIFIIVWHGGRREIIIWAFLNYLETVLEEMGNMLSKTELFLKVYSSYMNPKCLRRTAALLSVPLLSLSCISQYFFLSNNDTAEHHIKRIIQENFLVNGIVLFIAYCACQVSIETKIREEDYQKQCTQNTNEHDVKKCR